MSLIDGIVNLSVAQSMSQVQTAVAAKVLRLANDQGQTALQLLDAAMQNQQTALQNVAGDLTSVDAYA